MRKCVPTFIDIPEPSFVPQNIKAIREGKGVVGAPPSTLHEFYKGGRAVHHSPHSYPSLHLPF